MTKGGKGEENKRMREEKLSIKWSGKMEKLREQHPE
jgi:hypothetical protein